MTTSFEMRPSAEPEAISRFAKGNHVAPSLSLILPVRNAQYSLSRQINWLLEHAPELTSQFEILIVDDRSTDFTSDISRPVLNLL